MVQSKVADIMTRDVVTLREEDNLESIAAGMEKFALRHLPVLDGRKLVGLVTHRDILRMTRSALDRAAASDLRDQQTKSQTFVSAVMTRDPKAIRPDATLGEAARLMVSGKFGCLPVVDNENNLVGIITEHDLLKHLAAQLSPERSARAGDSRSRN